MQKLKFIFILSFLLYNIRSEAQPTLDTIRICLQHKPHPFLKLDTRNSFIDNDLVNIFGIKGGLSYYKRLNFGLGYYQLYNPPGSLKEDVHYVSSLGNHYTVSKGLKMYYISANVEYSFYESKHWELTLPLQVGLGKTYYQYTAEGVKYRSNKNFNFIYEPTISVDYKIIRWVGLNAAFGYRFMLAQTHRLNKQFNSPIVAFGISIYYSEIFKALFPDSRLTKDM